MEAISVQVETLLSQLSHRTASQPHQPQGSCSGIINHHTTLTKLTHSETEKKKETVGHLDVLRAGIVKDIYQLCEREKVGLLLPLEVSHLVILDKVLGLARNCGVRVHHIFVHYRLGSE